MKFLKEQMQEWIKKEVINSEPTAPYQPDPNGVAALANRTVIQRMGALFIETDLLKKFCHFVFDAIFYVKNRKSTPAISNS